MKRKIALYLKVGLLLSMVATGFLFTYAYIWILIGMPGNWWVAVALAVLSGISTLGLFRWIGKEDHVPVRCCKCQYWAQHGQGDQFGTCFCDGFKNGVIRRDNEYCNRGKRR